MPPLKDARFRRWRTMPKDIHETIVAGVFLLPAICFFAVFVVYPIIVSIFTSFFNYSINRFEFLGFGNYINLFKDEVFLKSMKNTIVLVIGVVPFIILFSIFVALTIYQKSSLVCSFFRGVFYLPVVTGTVSVIVVWKWIFDPLSGILNWFLETLGMINQPIMWLGDKHYALWSILLVLFTTSIGQPIVLYIAALSNLDKSHIEAAEIDGATNWQVFKYIKWPCIMPTTLYVVVITIINSFQCFSLIQLLTSGGPNYHTSTVMYLVYETAFKLTQFGYANAMGVILAVVIGFFSILQFKFFSNKVEY
jgi:multiple sugar transport system permease protein